MPDRGKRGTARAFEHDHLDAFFKLVNAAAECGLPQEQNFRGLPKAPMIGGCYSVAKVM
jgi:hypothetical protein